MPSTNVEVLHGDAAALGFPDASFDTVATCTMLHHVPTRAGQDKVLAEAFRVLRPGGTFLGSDSLPSDNLHHFHEGDTYNPVAAGRVPHPAADRRLRRDHAAGRAQPHLHRAQGEHVMTGTAALRRAVTGLLSFAAAEEQALLAADAFGPDGAGEDGPDRWAAAPLVAHHNQFKSQQAERIRCVLSGQVPTAYGEIDHSSEAVYLGYLAQPPDAVLAAAAGRSARS